VLPMWGSAFEKELSVIEDFTQRTRSSRKCFICDQPRHFANQCPKKKTNAMKKSPTSGAERARAAGRVFAMTTTKATQSGNLILEPCLLLGHAVLVLFDFGATHSSLSNACVGRLSLEKRDWGVSCLFQLLPRVKWLLVQSVLGV